MELYIWYEYDMELKEIELMRLMRLVEYMHMRYDNIEDVLMSIKSIERNEFVRNMIVNFNRLLFV